jgi:hypothetical protein
VIAVSTICKYCKKRSSATRHRLELDLAHDRVERVTCTASLRFIWSLVIAAAPLF